MIVGLDQLLGNLNVSFEFIVMIVMFLGSLVFFANTFQLGITMLFLMSGGVFMWFYAAGLVYTYPLIVTLACLVVMALSIIFMSKTDAAGGFT